MSRIDQVNELLKHELASLINEQVGLDGGLITVSYVDTSPDLRHAKIGISVLPEKFFGTALHELQKHTSAFSKELLKRTRLRQIPHLHWEADATEAKAAEIEKLLKDA